MILVVDMNCKEDSLAFYEFVSPIVTIILRLSDCEVKHYLKIKPADLSRCSKIILSGTALKDQATLKQTEKFQWIEKFDKPLLGICAGMQTIGLVFGESLERCLQFGMTEVKTLKENPLFQGKFNAYGLHNYSVTSFKTFEILAESAKCVQAIKHRQRSIYGVLFHPEVRNPEILTQFVRMNRY
jgi:GMP synthase (glutamine-hydrolysing)